MSEAIGKYFTINHVALLTGLTDRTLRSYIRAGLLQGEKINGLWHFSPEQVDAFVRHPAVRPSILAKNNAVIYDFLLDDRKREAQLCTILDLPGSDPKQTAETFCYEISNNPEYHDLAFRFDSITGTPRVILKGPAAQIMTLIQKCFQG